MLERKSDTSQIIGSTRILFQIRQLIFVILLLIVFEAPMRKWIFPRYSNYIFFIRDPFIVLVYFLSLRTQIFRLMSPIIYLGMFFSFMGGVLAMLQIQDSQIPFLIYAYGWRNHFLVIPLAGIIGVVFTKDDFCKLVKLFFYISLPSFVLAYFQSTSPIGHWINAGFAGHFTSMPVLGKYIRPTGLFSSSFGQGQYLIMLFTFLSGLFLDAKHQIHKRLYFLAATCSIFSLLICGQRGTFVSIAILFVSILFISLFLQRAKQLKALKFLCIILISLLCSSIFFTNHVNALWERTKGAAKSASKHKNIIGYDVLERIIGGFTHFTLVINTTPTYGYGLGFQGNAAARFAPIDKYYKVHFGAEDEWSKHILEFGPIFGLLFISFRILVFLYLFAITLSIAIKQQVFFPFLLFSAIAPLIFYAQLTSHGLASGWVWIFIGVILSKCKNINKRHY